MKIFDDTHPIFKEQVSDIDNFSLEPDYNVPGYMKLSLYKDDRLVKEIPNVVFARSVNDEFHFKQQYIIMN